MKTLSSIMFTLFFPFLVLAQIPSKIDFQAVARDGQGAIMAQKKVSIQLSILAGPLPGTIVYQERHAVTTDDFGLFVIGIGSSQNNQGVFADIEWKNGPHFVQVEMDPDGGTNFVDLGTLEMMTVPYAFYAKEVENADDADADPKNELQKLELNGEVLKLSQGNTVQLPDADPQNELQLLSFGEGNLLSISRGNTIQLPSFSSRWKEEGQSVYLASGRVGIGLDKPSNPLSIYNQNRASMNFLTDESGSGQEDGFTIGLNKLSNSALVWNYERGDIHFGTDNETQMYLSPFGRLGIGTTSPNAKLEVSSSNQDVGIRISAAKEKVAKLSLIETTTPQNYGFSWEYDGLKKELYLRNEGFQNGLRQKILTITPQGTIGLNNDNPGTIFSIGASEAESTLIDLTNENYPGSVLALGLKNGNPMIDFAESPLQIKAKGKTAMIIHNQSGNVGIGNLDPKAALDVTGDLLVSEDAEVMGTLTIGQGSTIDQIQEFTGTTFDQTDFTNISYPSGYTKSNTRVLSLQILSEDGNWLGIGTGNSVDRINVVLLNDKIKFNHPPLKDYKKRPFRLLLLRMDE